MKSNRVLQKFLKTGALLIGVVFLTIISQVGGLLLLAYAISLRKWEYGYNLSWYSKTLIFAFVYLLTSLLFVPLVAALTGRVPLPFFSDSNLKPRSYFTVLANRHYVKPEVRSALVLAAKKSRTNYGLTLYYLDANFPFIDGFPLFPHLSHKDGKKVDLDFIYENDEGPSKSSPSWMGYGVYSNPYPHEEHTNQRCKKAGYFQYDYPKYLSPFPDTTLKLSEQPTSFVITELLKLPETSKIFIEPHLKQRLGLSNESKIRFQGCRAVRHDDHIHWQMK